MIRRRPTQAPPYRTDRETLLREIQVETFRARGAGGQHVNRTESAVRLVHPPSGVVVQAQESRSQIRNREVAFERLQSTLRRLNARRRPRKQTRVPAAERARRVADKRRLGARKQQRQRPNADD